jgi:hypothetical protein
VIRITNPNDGNNVFHIGDVVTVTVVVTDTAPGDGPFSVIIRDAELVEVTRNNVTLNTPLSVTFTIHIAGSGFFTAFVEDSRGQTSTAFFSYSVS